MKKATSPQKDILQITFFKTLENVLIYSDKVYHYFPERGEGQEGVREGITNGQKFWNVIDMFTTLIVAMGSQMYIYVKTYHIAYFIYIQGLEYQSYINKSVLKKIKAIFPYHPPNILY